MTMQDGEILTYKEETFTIQNTEPLTPYLEGHPQIQFDANCSALWRGYLGSWEIKGGKLSLKNIEADNQSMESIFKSNEPQFAFWYSGEITVGLDQGIFTGYFLEYEHNLQFKITDGIVKSTKIFTKAIKDSYFNFGKYEYESVQNLIFGKYSRNKDAALKTFINEIIDFSCSENYQKVLIAPKQSASYINLKKIDLRWKHDFDLQISNEELNFNLINSEKEKELLQLIDLIRKILGENFKQLSRFGNLENKHSEVVNRLFSPDLSYLWWTIENVKSFSVHPDWFINQKIEYKRLIRINTIFIKPYKVKLDFLEEKKTTNIDPYLFSKNEQKFCLHNNLLKDNGLYVIDKDNQINSLQFGFYLYEWIKDKPTYKQGFKDNSSSKYEKYQNSYAQYYEDLDDDFIDSALDGDPDNYWNID